MPIIVTQTFDRIYRQMARQTKLFHFVLFVASFILTSFGMMLYKMFTEWYIEIRIPLFIKTITIDFAQYSTQWYLVIGIIIALIAMLITTLLWAHQLNSFNKDEHVRTVPQYKGKKKRKTLKDIQKERKENKDYKEISKEKIVNYVYKQYKKESKK